MLTRCYITALVIFRALVPSRPGQVPPGAAVPSGYCTVPPGEVGLCLGDLSRAVGKDGRLALFFPCCGAAAAPFVLFRLKRQGYSNCRATVTGDGMLVEGTR